MVEKLSGGSSLLMPMFVVLSQAHRNSKIWRKAYLFFQACPWVFLSSAAPLVKEDSGVKVQGP
jgi:hypothetical protein